MVWASTTGISPAVPLVRIDEDQPVVALEELIGQVHAADPEVLDPYTGG
jgi:hypothetical protein